MTLTHEQLRRRIQQELQVSTADGTYALELRNALKTRTKSKTIGDTLYSTSDRIKGKIIETILPVFNLTTYNNLKRARRIANDHSVQVAQLEQKLMQQYHENQTLISKDDPLIQQNQIQLEEAHRQIAVLNRTNHELQLSLEETSLSLVDTQRSLEETQRQADEQKATLSQELNQAMTELHVASGQRHILEVNVKQFEETLRYVEWQNKILSSMLNRYIAPASQIVPVDAHSILTMIERVTEELHNPATRDDVRGLLLKHFENDGDPNFSNIIDVFEQADREQISFWDIRSSARVLSGIIKPERYLEIGTRRGWSLAQVLIESPQAHCYIFDMWLDNYAQAAGSPTYVLNKMREIIGVDPNLVFINGNSHSTLPLFFEGKMGVTPPETFDLITVDGDHSLLGAWEDLYDVFPKVRVGGAILFDDLDYAGEPYVGVSEYEREPMPTGVKSLRDVWQQFQARYPNFVFIDCFNLRFQAGIAIRMR